MSATPAKMVALIDAAFRLQVRYQLALDMVLRGELEGEKRAGRWFVTEAGIERALAAKGRSTVSARRPA